MCNLTKVVLRKESFWIICYILSIYHCSLDTKGPKHGKEDPNNDPHVGGNTWAGGTGGRDTAGLGGKGGPYRLDKGHKVHQVTDLTDFI